MAPIRRYLRITKYSVLECRIYVDNPALAESWLLNSRNPVFPRVIESVRPLVLPKLLEEKERRQGKGGKKKKGVKDVVVEEDFEVSIFLTETSTRHSLLTKQKHFRDTNKKGLQSNSHKLTGATNDTAIEVEDASVPTIRREESEEDALDLNDLPSAEDTNSLFVEEGEGPRRSKRSRPTSANINSSPEPSPGSEPRQKRMKSTEASIIEGQTDDNKKLAMDTSYEGFSIYGQVLCLVVKRRDAKGKGPGSGGRGQEMMEDWIISTQLPPMDDD